MTSPAILEAACHELRRAVRVEGPAPFHHRAVESRARAEWPTLWHAIDHVLDVLDELQRDEPRPAGGISDEYGDGVSLQEALASGAFDVEPDESLRCGQPVGGFACTRSIGHDGRCWATGSTTIEGS